MKCSGTQTVGLIFLLLLPLSSIVGCSSSAGLGGTISSVTLGSGGGFTGRYTGYTLDRDGAVVRWNGDGVRPDSVNSMIPLPDDTTGYYFERLGLLGIDTVNFNHPHNLTTLIRARVGDSLYVIRWGDPRHTPPEEVVRYYRDLMGTIQRHQGY